MKSKYNLLLFLFALSFGLGTFFFAPKAQAGLELVKSVDFGTVYYIDSRNVRHPFPNEITYTSWYGHDFSSLATVSNDILANFPMGKNITIRPGTYLVKIRTASQVYTVEQGGVLRELQNESIAAAIYGENWASQVVDVPDVFFGDYVIGNEIRHDYTVPNSILFKDPTSDTFFYKESDTLRKFDTIDDVLVNNFDLNFALEVNRSYFIRERPIVGFDKNIFNPVAEPIVEKRDCANIDLRVAIIVVADKEINIAELDKVQTVKREISSAFSWATREFSAINVDYPTSVLLDDGFLIQKRNDGSTEVRNEVINTFYDNNPDEFDFLIIFTNFAIPPELNSNETARYVPITNKVEGINKANLDRSAAFGSQGKLKGVIVMGNINKYDTQSLAGLNQTLDTINHEFLHAWSAYIDFTDGDDESSDALLRQSDLQHWSIYAGFTSPLGGAGWIDNGNGTFTNGLLNTNSNQPRQYSDLDLYLMGLIPAQLMDDLFYIEPAIDGAIDNTIAGTKKIVTIDQIIDANGKIKCSFD